MVVRSSLLACVAINFIAVKFWPEYFSTSSSVLFTSAVVLASIIHKIFIYPYYLSPLRHLPGPPVSNPLLGHFVLLAHEHFGHPEETFAAEIPNQGLIRYFGLFGAELIAVTHPRTAIEVCSTKVYDYCKPGWMVNGTGRSLGATSVLFVEGAVHKRMRRMFNPAFHVKRVKGFVPLFWEKAQVLLRELGKEVQELEKKEGGEGVVVNMEHWVSRTTLDIIGKAGFNYDFNTLQKERSTISDAYKVVFDPPSNLTTRYLNGILIFFPRLFLIVENLPLPELREIKRCYLILWNLAKDLIREGRSSVDAETGEEKRDILSVVRGMGESKEEELRDQVLTFLAAGHDTTSTTLLWALHVLVRHPEMQTRLRNEIHEHLPTSTSPISLDTFSRMKFLHQFISEVLRFYPPVPLLLRETLRPTRLGSVLVPKGTLINVVIGALNRSTELWGPTAEIFDPSRWEEENGGAKSNYAFMTLSAGARICIGKDFAREEFPVLLAALVGGFEWGLVEGEWMEAVADGLTNKPKGLRCRLKRVEW